MIANKPELRTWRQTVSGSGYGRTTPARGGRTTGRKARNPVPARVGTQEAVTNGTGTERGREMVVLRREIGDVLRDARQRQGRTLREVSSAARVSLGYLSEVERGQKEASSELLASICDALDVPMSLILREVSDRIAVAEGYSIPDTIPADLMAGFLARGGDRSAQRRDVERADLAPIG